MRALNKLGGNWDSVVPLSGKIPCSYFGGVMTVEETDPGWVMPTEVR